MPMSLLVRINLVLGTALGIVGVVLSYFCWEVLQANAKREVTREAGLMMDSALATRTYTSLEILPLLAERMRTEFLPQTVPFYAATQNFLKLREQHPAYSYKEAALNPTNPRDRAADWEGDLIQQFRNDPATHEVMGERDTPMGRALYLARPIRAESECLACHSAPSSAPATLITRYGSDNGFGWQLNEIVGAHVVSVPLAGAIATAEATFRDIVTSIGAVLIALLAIVNGVVYFLVVRPIRRMAGIAEELSTGSRTATEIPSGGSSELAMLARSFNRLRTSLDKAMKLLEP
jgi:HAMP domain-containing protein